MRKLALLSVLAVGCSAPFTMAPYPADDAGPGEDAPTVAEDAQPDAKVPFRPDAGSHETGIQAPDAAHEPEVQAPDAAPLPDAAPDVVHVDAGPAPGTCPSAWTLEDIYCPSGCGPCPAQQAPEYTGRIFLSTCSAGGAGGVGTPATCQACGSYTCACLLAALPNVCGSGVTPACHEGAGEMPTFVCP